MMMKIVTGDQMRRIDQECIGMGTPASVLMENAGRAVAEEIQRQLAGPGGQQVLVLSGPGNNGGDGLVAARYLHDWGARVSVYLCSQRGEDGNLEKVRQRGIACLSAAEDAGLGKFRKLLDTATCVVDALFGTGKLRPLEGVFRGVLEGVNQAKRARPSLFIVAVDLPSGLNADTGEVDPACLRADITVTLGFPKPGLFRFPGAEMAGRIFVADIGIPASLAEGIDNEMITGEWARAALPPRPLNANKGTFGRVLVVAGSSNYLGAAYLAASGAVRVGAGLVTLAAPASLLAVLAAKLTETTFLPLPEVQPGVPALPAADIIAREAGHYQSLLLGCGLGQGPPAMKFISSVFLRPGLPALVLDADALNTLAQVPGWWRELSRDAILTPHPGEMARLGKLTVAGVQADRVAIAREKAGEWRKTVVLKGAYTVVASPGGVCRVNPVANPGLATAGTGDVLSGAIAGLVAQGLSLFDAATLGVYLHAAAGEMVRASLGDAGMTASDLLPVLPLAIRELKKAE